MYPGYLKLFHIGKLQHIINILKKHYYTCTLCPHQCEVNRSAGEKGICRSGDLPVVASFNTHLGEEPPVSGLSGSGTIFFTGCSGRCVFCQNYPISQLGTGKEVTINELAEMMLVLQKRKCNNINLVTPTHFLPSIVAAISIGASRGLHIPIVYNTGGYERVEILQLLNGIVDIYLPDAKYADNSVAREFSGFTNYVDHNRASLIEMFNQVGNLQVNEGVAVQGMIVRHLILPDNLGGTEDTMKFLAENISLNIYVSLMDQYFPAYKAFNNKEISRKITSVEYHAAIEAFYKNGLHNGWIQDHTRDE